MPSPLNQFPGPHAIFDFELHERVDRSYATFDRSKGVPHRSILPRIEAEEVREYEVYRYPHTYPATLDLHQIKVWIGHCQDQHISQCATHPHHRLKELKVIDCDLMRIIHAPLECQYIALSYVWGTGASLPSITDTPALHEAPRTIVDAIRVTKGLGYRYLWVDRYCITQDDATRKHIQIAQMGEIYAAATLTIIAAIGDGPSHGLPGVAGNDRGMAHEVIGNWCVKVWPPSRDLVQITQSRWATRAWTFQESILSTRRLILTERQAIFICNAQTHFESEADNGSLEDPFLEVGWLPPRGLVSRRSPLQTAITYLVAYSERKLSYDLDALNAILGALNTLRKDSVYHIWGLPLKHTESKARPAPSSTGILTCDMGQGLGLPLSWFHWKPARRRIGFPSWSLLGWEGAVHFWHRAGKALPMAVNLPGLSIQTDTERQTMSSTLLSSIASPTAIPQSLHLQGETYTPLLVSEKGVALPFDEDFSYMVSVHWSTIPSTFSPPTIKAVLIRTSTASTRGVQDWLLLISPAGDTWERIGFATLDEDVKNPFQRPSYLSAWLGPDLEPLNARSAISLSAKYKDHAEHFADPGRWWRRHFKPESITLG